MKKIFLTSGIVLCMACPAFAAGDGNPNITVTNDNGTITTDAANCESDVLETSTAGQYVNFKALWTANKGTITLVNDSSYTTVNCPLQDNEHPVVTHTSSNANWNSIFNAHSSYQTLYTRYDDAVYATSSNGTLSNPITSIVPSSPSSASTPTLTGYTFGGYWSAAGGTGTQYIYGASDVRAADPQNNITAIANGDFVMASTTDQNDPRYGHALLDQYVSSAGGTGTLYAKWTPNTYTITYDCGVITPAGSANPVNVLRKLSVEPSDNGYNANSPVFVDNTQSVTYDDCYGLNSVTQYCSGPEGYTLPENVSLPTGYALPSGYVFGGWRCTDTTTGLSADLPGASLYKTLPATANATGYPANTAANSLYTADAAGTWTHDGNITCTAIWKANSINLTWDVNGGTAGTTAGADSCIYDTSISPLPSVPTKTGYTFAGWDVQSVTATAPSNDD